MNGQLICQEMLSSELSEKRKCKLQKIEVKRFSVNAKEFLVF